MREGEFERECTRDSERERGGKGTIERGTRGKRIGNIDAVDNRKGGRTRERGEIKRARE